MIVENGDIKNAVVSFVDDDLSHGYVVLFEKVEDLHPKYIYNRDLPSYKFHPAKDTKPEKWQIVEVEIAHKKRFKLATITRNTYVGRKGNAEFVKPVGELIRNINQLKVQNTDQEYLSLGQHAPVDFFLYYNELRKKLIAHEPAPLDNKKFFYEELKLDFTYYTNQLSVDGMIKAGEIVPLLLNNNSENLLVQFQLKYLVGKLEEKKDDDLSTVFLKTFTVVAPKVLDIESCLRVLDSDIMKFIRLWLSEKLPDNFLNSQTIQGYHAQQGLFKKLEPEEFYELFYRIRSFPNYAYLLESGLNAIDEIPENYLKEFTRLVNFSANQDYLRQLLYKKLSFESLLYLWHEGEIKEIPAEQCKNNFNKFSEDDRKQLFESLNLDTYLDYAGTQEECSPEIIIPYLEEFSGQVGEKIKYCCFDLEVNPLKKEITELAFTTSFESLDFLQDELDEGIPKLKEQLKSAELIIGHNIREFDLKQLYGNDLPKLRIWDTLEIENLLRPDAVSLALDTKHEALEDVKNTLELFFYQLFRVFRDNALKDTVFELFGLQFIRDVAIPILNIQKHFLDKPVLDLFHSNFSGISNAVRFLVPDGFTMIICPEEFWGFFRDEKQYQFIEENHPNSFVLDRNKWIEKLKDHPYLYACLDNYERQCEQNKTKAYARLLSPYLVQLIQEHFPLKQICKNDKSFGGKIITSEWFFESNQKDLLVNRKEEEVLFFGTDLWPFLSKRCFGEFTQEELSLTEEGKSLWVRFSNGRSYAQISKHSASNLSSDIFGDRFWLERKSLDKYLLWGSNAILLNKSYANIKLEKLFNKAAGLPKTTANYIKYTNNSRAALLDLNPETLYRDKYWDVKLKTLFSLLSGNKVIRRCVLVISRFEEVEPLTEVIKSLRNWYSPSLNAGLRRRLELLVEAEEGVMVITQDEFAKLLSYPIPIEVSYVVESLSPEELLHSSGLDRENNVEEVEEDSDREDSESSDLPHFSSVFGSINKLSRFYDWMLYQVSLQQKSNQLVILDPRVSNNIFENFSSKSISVDFHKLETSDKIQFTRISEKTKFLLYAPREFEYGNLEEHLKRISAVLIDGHDFKPEQKDYLDLIFPAKEDVLVTLPTGLGKSVLFQGPSLYRSSFTGRMSIVVTPLKALMEDHVMSLWKKGFWNGVEFINADKGPEVKDIYRKIAGGQLLMVFVTPERFRSKGFIKALNQRMEIDGGLEYFIFDEAHCISQWGSEFRPDYYYCAQQIKQIRKTFKSPLILLSATVTKQVALNLENALYEEV